MTWRDRLRELSFRDVGEWLRWVLLHNAGVKLLALVIAFGLWFFVTLAPASSIVPVATEVGAERRMYLPLMAIAVLFAIALGMKFSTH